MRSDPIDINSSLITPLRPHVLVLFGAAGDLARRKLLPGLFHLAQAGLLPEYRILGTSLDDLDDATFRDLARGALDRFAHHGVPDEDWDDFSSHLFYLGQSEGPDALAKTVAELEDDLGGDVARLHYLSVPPAAAPEVVQQLGDVGLADRARIIMEKPFGTDLASAVRLNDSLHATFDETQIYDAMSGDHTLFSSAEGIESLWEHSQPLLEHRPPCARTHPAPGDRTRSISWSHPTRGGSRSSAPGAPPTRADAGAASGART